MPNLEPDNYPELLYVFVPPTNWLAQHNLTYTGRLFSSTAAGLPQGADNLPFLPNPAFGGALSPFLSGVINHYRVEHDVEAVRRRVAPEAPSRLTSVYAFGDEESCHAAADAHGWKLDTVQKFRLVEDLPLRVRRVNMEIVSLGRLAYATADLTDPDIEQLWTAYWNGDDHISMDLPTPPTHQTFHSGCIWEYLIDGYIELV